jgi:hypothetical protein
MRFLRLLLFITVLYPIHAQTIGGGTCTQSTLNGTFFYLLGGTVVSQGVGYAYAELVKLIPDGNGNVSGHSESSLGGSLTSYTLTGTYTVQGNCSATMALSVNGQAAIPVTVQITNGGLAAVLALSNSNQVVAGRAYRQTAQAGSIQCGNGSLSGARGASSRPTVMHACLIRMSRFGLRIVVVFGGTLRDGVSASIFVSMADRRFWIEAHCTPAESCC